jgi:dTDP-4-dehydrorhamnose reductase
MSRILLTGGSGRLGRELSRCLSDVHAPPSSELDVTRPATIDAVLDRTSPDIIVHAAAFTDVAGAEAQRQACWRVNVEGTRNIVRAAGDRSIFLVHISTDYLHIATERKSVYDLARRRRPDVEPASRHDAGVSLPDDCSLDVSRWLEVQSQLGGT